MTEYAPAYTGQNLSNIPQCLKDHVCCVKYLKDNECNSLNDMQGYYVLGIFCNSKPTDFLELCSKKTVCFWELIMSADIYFYHGA